MKINAIPPSETEAVWSVNGNRLVIQPKFRTPGSLQPIGYVETVGDSGTVKRGTLYVSGKTGRVHVRYVDEEEAVLSIFDQGGDDANKVETGPANVDSGKAGPAG